jgi:asparagine synthase (glutamine-hydrolysing)
MCGIAGYTHISCSLPDGVLDAALQGMIHRGPDQQAGYITPHVSLGATRLRIIDLQGGDQPMHSQDGRCTIVFNGEIYNFRSLREELERLGRCFRSRCDTEVVLNAYLEWGNKCFARLRGMFAVALWDEQEQRLILARDRAGIKPLYYLLQGEEIFFGSEMKCIFAHPGVPRKIDLDGLNCFLSLNYVPGPFTLIEGIRKLMPGHFLEWQRGRVFISSFVPRPSHESPPRSMAQATEELDALLRFSVTEQMISDVPIGVWLSGGIDSSTITHYAAHLSSTRLKTFSITFPGKSFDESAYVRAVAKLYGTEHFEIDLNENADLSDVIAEMSYYSDEPGADAGAVPVWYLAKMTRSHATVALSGEGADELFGGYLMYKADRYRRACSLVPRPLLRGALACARRLPASDEKIGFDYKLQRFLQGSLLTAEKAHVFWNGTFTEDEKRELCRFANSRPLSAVLRQMRSGRSLERFLEFDQRYSLPDALLYKVDRMSMAHSVEVRPPFLDDRIVDFAARLPQQFKIRRAQSKIVMRALMRKVLPEAVLKRPKTGLDIPIHEWFRGILRPLLMESLNETSVRETGLLHWPAVERLIDEHQNRRANWGYHLWGLMTLILWMKRWNVEAPATGTQVLLPREKAILEEPSLLL